jgi:uncharacterized protein YggU (UPF0235/DUF167 family)
VRLEIYVRPGASKTAVGGEYGGALVVRVAEPAEGGRATQAALDAVADALGLPRRSVALARGATSRRKIVDIVAEHLEPGSVSRIVSQLRAKG